MNTSGEQWDDYRAAIMGGSAGCIELDPADDPGMVEGSLLGAAREADIPIIVGWVGGGRDLLAWRRLEGSAEGLVLLGIRPCLGKDD